MQRIERPQEAPSILRSKAAAVSRRQMRDFWALDRERRAQTSVPPIGIDANDPKLVEALATMSDRRCAFCEATDDLSAHRFRPQGNALPLREKSNAHLYYLWLVDAWQNLLPICRGCIPPEPQFPVLKSRAQLPPLRQVEGYVERGDGIWPSFPPKEAILLLDPAARSDFERHLIPKIDGELIGESRIGETTIAVYDLNRADRRHQRYLAYQRLLERLRQALDRPAHSRQQADWDGLFAFSKLEFGGTWFLLLRRIARLIGALSSTRPRTSRTMIQRFYDGLGEPGEARGSVETALEALAREDGGLRAGRRAVGAIYLVRAPVTEVAITNFKAIERLTIQIGATKKDGEVRTKPRTASLVILGENATGKSSILEAIALALTTKSARDALELPWSKLPLDPSQLGLERGRLARRAEVRVQLATGQSTTLAIEQGVPTVRSELGNQVVPVFAYGAFRRFASGTRRFAPHKHIRNLFDGDTLSNPEPWLKSLNSDDFNLVIRTLRGLLSVEGEFDVIQRDRTARELRVVTSLTEPDGSPRYIRTPLQAVSSGYRSMLAMLCDVMRGLLDPRVYESFESFETARGIVLIDEIEAHLHPRWKVQVMSSLRSALPGMTFIVTTHDPLCLRGMDDGEVVALQRIATVDSSRESQLPILVEQIEGLPPVSELRIEQLLTSDFFQLLSTDDAAADRRLARIADLIAARAAGIAMSEEDVRVLRDFERDIATALPVGSSEVHRIVQEAVAIYLERRRDASRESLVKLREDTKTSILTALEAL